jgi:hypothetical protein
VRYNARIGSNSHGVVPAEKTDVDVKSTVLHSRCPARFRGRYSDNLEVTLLGLADTAYCIT